MYLSSNSFFLINNFISNVSNLCNWALKLKTIESDREVIGMIDVNVGQVIDLYEKGTITVGNDGKISMRIEKPQAVTCSQLKNTTN